MSLPRINDAGHVLKAKYKGRYCCVVNCHSVQGRDDVRFSRFPKRNPEQAEAWRKAVNRQNPDGSQWFPNARDLVCGLHFVSGNPSNIQGSPDYVPTRFPTAHKSAKSESDVQRHERALKRAFPDGIASCSKDSETDVEAVAMDVDDGNKTEDTVSLGIQTTQILGDNKTTQTSHVTSASAMIQTDDMIGLQTPAAQYLQRILQTEAIFRSICGITRKFFELCVKEIGSKLPRSSLTPREQIALFWKKLKQNITFVALGPDFGVSDKTAARVFKAVLQEQFMFAKSGLWWHTRQEIDAMMPDSFKLHYPQCRVIIDASEIKIQTPSDVSASILTWSSYKHHHTLKFLVGISPGGMIIFVSKAYGGRVTDVHITTDSGILDLLEPNDQVMADKGFPRIEEDVVERRGFLVMPPFKQGNRQFSSSENDSCYRIASLRIHVERAIQRMKIFRILSFLENSLIPSIDMILVVVSHSVNYSPPLINSSCDENPE